MAETIVDNVERRTSMENEENEMAPEVMEMDSNRHKKKKRKIGEQLAGRSKGTHGRQRND